MAFRGSGAGKEIIDSSFEGEAVSTLHVMSMHLVRCHLLVNRELLDLTSEAVNMLKSWGARGKSGGSFRVYTKGRGWNWLKPAFWRAF